MLTSTNRPPFSDRAPGGTPHGAQARARPRIATASIVPALLWLAGALGGCATAPPRDPGSEQCYRHGAVRTCTTPPAATAEQIAAVHRLSLPSLGRGRLLIVRNDWRDAHGHAGVLLDGHALLETIPCSVVGVDVVPGPHTLQVAPAGAKAAGPFEVGSGELQVWQIRRVQTGGRGRGFALSLVDAERAGQLVSECRVLGLLDRARP